MKSKSADKIKMPSIDELLGVSGEESATDIEISRIHSFANHPFKVLDDDKMDDLVKSIKQNGVLTPVLVRPDKNNSYEMISGHRRMHAAIKAGLETIPAIVRDMEDDEAIVIMVDANIQREELLPSEKAFAYKMKMDAMKRQGIRTDLTSSQVETKLRSDQKVAEEAGESRAQIQRYIRLTELQPELQQMVDEKKMAFTPAVGTSYLKPNEQRMLLDTISSEQATPSLSQAQRLKKLSQSGELTDDSMLSIMSEQKKPERNDLTIPADVLEKFFPRSFTPMKMQEVIIKLLESWQRKRQQSRER